MGKKVISSCRERKYLDDECGLKIIAWGGVRVFPVKSCNMLIERGQGTESRRSEPQVPSASIYLCWRIWKKRITLIRFPLIRLSDEEEHQWQKLTGSASSLCVSILMNKLKGKNMTDIQLMPRPKPTWKYNFKLARTRGKMLRTIWSPCYIFIFIRKKYGSLKELLPQSP